MILKRKEKLHFTYFNCNSPELFRNITICKKWNNLQKIKISFKLSPRKMLSSLKQIVRISRINPKIIGIISKNGIVLIDNKTIQEKKISKKLEDYDLKNTEIDLYHNSEFNLENLHRFKNELLLSSDKIKELLEIYEQKMINIDLSYLMEIHQVLFDGSQFYSDTERKELIKIIDKIKFDKFGKSGRKI